MGVTRGSLFRGPGHAGVRSYTRPAAAGQSAGIGRAVYHAPFSVAYASPPETFGRSPRTESKIPPHSPTPKLDELTQHTTPAPGTAPAADQSEFRGGTGQLRSFMQRHYTNFNSRETLAAAQGYEAHLGAGGKMMVTLAGAMSTAGIGRVLARMIREDKVHAITCTGANLEEDIFLLLAGNEYEWVPNWRALTAEDEQALLDRGMNRVTDTCIPETVMRHFEGRLLELWRAAEASGERKFPHEWYREVFGQPDFADHFQMPAEDSWMLAAAEKDLPIYCPGWEDSTMGNVFTAGAIRGEFSHQVTKLGTEAMASLVDWYSQQTASPQPVPGLGTKRESELPGAGVGFFQVGGGIAGDFPICAVPLMIQDLKRADTPLWGYFAQVCDAVTSYGGYSGAVPNEKITWAKLAPNTPKFMIQSDATIVAPLIFGYVLGD